MKYVEVKVTSRCGNKSGPKVVVGSVKVPQAESLPELISNVGGEDEVLKLANAQLKTNMSNELRRTANTNVSDTKLRKDAVEIVYGDRDVMRELLSIEDDAVMQARREELVTAKMEELREKYEAAKAGVTGAAVEDDTEDDEE